MIVLGLTGSIAMGKTLAARQFRSCGIPVYDADKIVHFLLKEDQQVRFLIENEFPDVLVNGKIDRLLLGNKVFNNQEPLQRLEGILHPRLREYKAKFLRNNLIRRQRLVILDIPLLFEKGGELECDGVVVVSAPKFVQDHRVLKRPGMTKKKYLFILLQQLDDIEKRKKADFIINSGLGKRESLRKIRSIINLTRKWPQRNNGNRNKKYFQRSTERPQICRAKLY